MCDDRRDSIFSLTYIIC